MNILFLADVSIRERTSGAERVLYHEAAGLAARGHRVRILTRQSDAHLPEQEEIDGVREYRYPVDQRNALTFFRSMLRGARARFGRLLDEEPADLLHAHQPFTGFVLLGDPRRGTVPALYTCHSLAFEEYLANAPHPNRWLRAFHARGRRRLEREALRRSDRVTTLSEFMRQRMAAAHQISPGRIEVIPGGVDQRRFCAAPDKALVRQQLGLPANRLILFTVRNLVARMGLDNLIRAMGRVAGTIDHALLVIGGTGPLRPSLEALAGELGLQERVRFTGFIPEAELPLYYQAADFFILPTLQLEGFGLVTLEALASGLPVLGTRVGGTPEILDKLDPTFLFDSPEPEVMARLINKVTREYAPQSARYGILAIRCQRHVEEHYTWARHLDRLEALYARLCRR